jgi:hypothetical protein
MLFSGLQTGTQIDGCQTRGGRRKGTEINIQMERQADRRMGVWTRNAYLFLWIVILLIIKLTVLISVLRTIITIDT